MPKSNKYQEFEKLIESPEKSENDIQGFLEKNTEFLPVINLLHHNLHLNCIISKFPIGDFCTDFAYLTKSSNMWRLFLIEIEHPKKRLFLKRLHSTTHKDLNHAIAQVDAWRDHWEMYKEEVIRKITPLLIPLSMRQNIITLHRILVIGRDKELNDRNRQRLAHYIDENNIHILTYDSLLRMYKNERPLKRCILSTNAHGFRIKVLDGEPLHLFGHVASQNLNFSTEIELQLINLGYDIRSWKNGEMLTENHRLPMRVSRENGSEFN